MYKGWKQVVMFSTFSTVDLDMFDIDDREPELKRDEIRDIITRGLTRSFGEHQTRWEMDLGWGGMTWYSVVSGSI